MTLKAAMTKEEWAAKETPGNGNWQDKRDGAVARLEYDPSELYVWVESGFRVALGSHHAVAALCLHEQPFGFTWEDVEALHELARLYHAVYGERGNGLMRRHPLGTKAESIASRIEALLPPEDA